MGPFITYKEHEHSGLLGPFKTYKEHEHASLMGPFITYKEHKVLRIPSLGQNGSALNLLKSSRVYLDICDFTKEGI
jgi:hypothetical protein